jgi:D-serine deaminase-like pyridoxal phosphate-dependent protein
MHLDALPTPAAVVDLDVLEANVARQKERAASLGVALRPHVKTHKCVEIARMQRDAGARGITVSTLAEARAFADAGFDDITWAFPLIPSRLSEVRELASRVRLGVTVDSKEAVEALASTGDAFHVWLEVDCGDHRAGVDPEGDLGLAVAQELHDSAELRFEGVLTHAGHAYACRFGQGLGEIAEQERATIVAFADRVRDAGVSVERVSVGSTPTMSAVRDLTGVTEMRPGNYVFHDYTQTVIGSADVADCALTVVATVVSHRPGDGISVCDAGGLALSKEQGPSGVAPTMGRVYDDYGAKTLDEEAMLTSLSQEHGVLRGALAVGTRLRILPNHSCMAAACFDRYHVVRGEEIVAEWPIHRAR